MFTLYDNAFMFIMLLFGPMVLTIFSTWIISREYTDGTLKNIFVIPISRTFFLTGKLLFFILLTFVFMLISSLEIWVLALLCSCFIPVTELDVLTVIFFLMRFLFGGMLLCAIETPFIYLAIRTKGFMAPLIAITAIILINIVLSSSPIAGFYPWSASYLLVLGRLSSQGYSEKVSIFIILAICLLGIIASLMRFKKEEI